MLGAALLGGLLAAGGAQQEQALLEEFLELRDGPALEEHVPVGARRLDRLAGGGGPIEEQRLLTAAALPGRGGL